VSRYRMVVLSNAAAGREDEFNEWYGGQHISDILAIDGIESAQRFRLPGEPGPTDPYRYLAIYEIETDDIDAVRARLADPSDRVQSDSIDLLRTALWIFEEIGDKRWSEPVRTRNG
jgi:hypothetical protein